MQCQTTEPSQQLFESWCKVCRDAPAAVPVGAPDMCHACEDAVWARIFARAATQPASTPATNVWD